MSYSVVIPARYASSRLPGKPLLDIAGKPMIQHVFEKARQSQAGEVIIATDDERIRQVAERFGAQVVMTSADHASGTDRLQEVAEYCGWARDHIVVNVQGDEPMMPPAIIDQVAKNLASQPQAAIATLCEPIESIDDILNPNVVKVVFDRDGLAHYFSRAPIPWARDAWMTGQQVRPAGVAYHRHIGIYAYRVGLLHDFVRWTPAPLELVECLEQLRALWNGARIHVALAEEAPPAGVDTPEDLERVRRLLAPRE